ncbi:hypothetical protein AGOR_G00248030 [Albula goreensis]|uniref:SEFIR domain-containing protein n=1 Tax=Albula goreensis TaxID=1534307 RepID=A0A8T3CB43_9TELE|nr:hypothetical protein AGOR_G00248030 [Albula goreensis]
MRLFVFTVLSVHVILTSCLRILDWPLLNCTQEGLRCTADINNCMDKGWLEHKLYTPTAPQDLTVDLDVRRDEKDDLVPVIVVRWSVPTDASIKYMKGTEVNVLEMSVNLNRCVHYIFHDKITSTTNSRNERWSFSLDSVVVEPDQTYIISVNSLPRPNLNHDHYNVAKRISIPGCKDTRIKNTKICVETGSLWKPNIALERSTGQDGKPEVTVSFNTSELSEKYSVVLQCSLDRMTQPIMKRNQTSQEVTFALENWPRTCCIFKAEIQPFFTLCQNDCTRHVHETNICSHPAKPSTNDADGKPLTVGIICMLVVCLLCAVAWCTYSQRSKKLKDPHTGTITQKDPSFLLKDSKEDTANTPRKLLIVYSLDHPLYKDIVLKLCAFLRAKCGIEVVLDLLDGAWLGTVGRMQWLDWQKQQIEKSSDKILILCSRGVRAKWKAMRGEGRVILREDIHSPTGDMLTPALSLIIPDLLHAAAFEKYMVAYFEDVSCEDDVPAPFNITIKYKLMKHFEELYFRILGKEKHEPGRVNRIEGIAQDEYFNCPSGRALRDAIETLQAYQLENPDWFEKECVESEDKVAESDSQHPLLADTCNPIFQFVPECKEGPPVLVNEVETNEDSRCTQALMPLLNHGGESVSTSELYPRVHPGHSQVYSSHPVVLDTSDILDSGTYLSIFEGQQALNAELDQPDPSTQERLCQLEEFPSERYPVEDEEEAHTSFGPPSQETLQRLLALQQSLGPMAVPSPECVEDEYVFETEVPQPWMVEAGSSTRPQSGSDQGYISRSSIHHDSTFGDDSQNPLNTLSRLQEACLLNSLNPYRS